MSGHSTGFAAGQFCIYGLEADGRPFLVNSLFPNAQMIPLAVGQDGEAILQQISPRVRWFVWHVCLTYKRNVPRDRLALSRGLEQRRIQSLNEGVLDISKQYTQTVLARLGLPTTAASAEGDPGDLLFLKSNHNYGGFAEKQLSRTVRDYFGINLPHPLAPTFASYQLIERAKLLPEAFQNDDIFVERYIANEGSLFYRAFILFDAVVLSKLVCKGVIKKALEADFREDYFLSFTEVDTEFASAPDQVARRIMRDLHSFCRAIGLDMGAIDVLLDNQGVPHIIDVNPTAWGGENCDRPGLIEHLLKGLHARSEQSEL